jgi:hypothetical protein
VNKLVDTNTAVDANMANKLVDANTVVNADRANEMVVASSRVVGFFNLNIREKPVPPKHSVEPSF